MLTINENTITGSTEDDKIAVSDIAGLDYPSVVVYGLAGNDTLTFASNNIQQLTLYGGDGNDRIVDGAAANFLSGDAGDDIISSLGSLDHKKDTVFGGEGNDQITLRGDALVDAGSGDDTIYIQRGLSNDNDVVSGGDGIDLAALKGTNRARYRLDGVELLAIDELVTLDAKSIEDVTQISGLHDKKAMIFFRDAVTIDGSILDANLRGTLIGSRSDDIINISNTENRHLELQGDWGDDILTGNSGDDRLVGGEGSDTIFGGSGNDKILVDDTSNKSNAKWSNHAFGGNGNDYISLGLKGMNIASGGAGNDVFEGLRIGKLNFDCELRGDGGDDTFRLDPGIARNATIIGGSGRDVLIFNGEISDHTRLDVEVLQSAEIIASADTLNSFEELAGVQGRTTFSLSKAGVFAPKSIQQHADFNGSSGNDTLDLSHTNSRYGWKSVMLGDGNDRFIGTKHDDLVYGGNGSDVFVFDDHSGRDQIRDFTSRSGEHDVLDFSHSKIINNMDDLEEHLHGSDGDITISFGETKIEFNMNGGQVAHLSEVNVIF